MKYIFFSLLCTQMVFSQINNQTKIDSLKREILLLKIQNDLLKAENFDQNEISSSSSVYELNNLTDKILDSQLGYFKLAADQINVAQMEDFIDVVQNHKLTKAMRNKLLKELTYFKNRIEGEMKRNKTAD